MGGAGAGPAAVFVGLCTLDVVQLVDRVPGANEKVTSREQVVAAGGPAANAAAAYAHVGGAATLVTGLGAHPMAVGARADLGALGVEVVDLAADRTEAPAVSNIMVTAATGERAVVSSNAAGYELAVPADVGRLLGAAAAVEVDGHHMALGTAIARAARGLGRRTVLDAGSWKDGTDELLPWIDVAVCSADFRPPGTASPQDVLRHLHARGVRWAAVSRGAEPVLWSGPDGTGEVAVPVTRVVDTLGAGDVLHGALTYHLAAHGGPDRDRPFPEALAFATGVAAQACTAFGTRAWMTDR